MNTLWSFIAVMLSLPLVAKEESPNVILIYVDDLGYGDLGCYGATKVKTPRIDGLAKEGRKFTDAHSASGVCTPSRYALIAGEYPFRCGKGGTWGPLSHTSPLIIDHQKITLGKVFRNQGYKTAMIGKWHLGWGKGQCDWNKPLKPGPDECGFDYNFGITKSSSGYPFVYVENDGIYGYDPKDPLKRVKDKSQVSPTQKHHDKVTNVFGGAKKAHELYDDVKMGSLFTEKAVSWIKENKENPFFLYFATTHIHHPFTPDKRFEGTSACGPYGDFVHELDWMVGEVLRTVDELGLKDNTLVILTSDNGGMYNAGGRQAWSMGHRLNGPLLGFKFGALEGGHRVPMIVRWPGKVKAGETSHQLFSQVDMLATMASLVGETIPKGEACDSKDLLEVLVGEPKQAVRDQLVVCSRNKNVIALRWGKWVFLSGQGDGGSALGNRGGKKAIGHSGRPNSDLNANGSVKANSPTQQLYNLEEDLAQTTNVIRKHPEIAQKMKKMLKDLMKKKPVNE